MQTLLGLAAAVLRAPGAWLGLGWRRLCVVPHVWDVSSLVCLAPIKSGTWVFAWGFARRCQLLWAKAGGAGVFFLCVLGFYDAVLCKDARGSIADRAAEMCEHLLGNRAAASFCAVCEELARCMVQIAAWDGGGQRMQLGVPWCAARSMRTVSTPASIGQLLCVLGRRGHVYSTSAGFQ